MSTNPLKDLKKYASATPDEVGGENIMDALLRESDRAAVLVAASMLEDTLTTTIERRLRKVDDKARKDMRLFEPNGLVGGFSQKIDMAFALEVIDLPMRKALHHIREMRNACAHSFRELTFTKVPAFRKSVERLFDDDMEAISPKALGEQIAELKGAFILECWAMAMAVSAGRDAAMRYMTTLHGHYRQAQQAALKANGKFRGQGPDRLN